MGEGGKTMERGNGKGSRIMAYLTPVNVVEFDSEALI